MKPIHSYEDYTKAEEFVTQYNHYSLDSKEEKLCFTELMGYYDEKYIIPRYKLTPQE